MVDFIEDPYCLYPLRAAQTLFQAALEMVRSMVVGVGREGGLGDVGEEEIRGMKEGEEGSGTRQDYNRRGMVYRGGLGY